MTDIVERLKKPVYCEDLMRCWDRWRKQHKEGFAGSATRDEFESIIDGIDEERTEAAAEIERLREEVARLVRSRNRWGQKYNRTLERLKLAVEVMRTCRAVYVENDDAAALGEIIDRINAFLAKMEGQS